jgi:hypothetical protein
MMMPVSMGGMPRLFPALPPSPPDLVAEGLSSLAIVYIFSGAETPTTAKPFFKTCLVAQMSNSLACFSAASSTKNFSAL